MKELLQKFFALLRTNKKKAFSALILAVLYILWRKKSSIVDAEKMLGKFQQKIMKQMEENLKQQQILGEKLQVLEDLEARFKSTLPDFKAKISKQISQFFIINDLKEDLKKKDLTQAEKQQLWDRFKEENLLFAVMALTVSPLPAYIRLIKEIVLNKALGSVNPEVQSKESRKIIEKILENFTENLIETGLNEVFFSNKSLEDDFSRLRISAEFTFNGIYDVFAGFERKSLEFIEKKREQPCAKHKSKDNLIKGYWKNGISEKVSGVDYDEIGNYLISKSKASVSAKKEAFSFFGVSTEKKLSIPTVLLRLISIFLDKTRKNPVLTDPKHCQSMVNAFKTVESANVLEEVIGKSPELIIDENLIMEKSREKSPNRENGDPQIVETVMAACNEIVDWIESQNFQVLYYHCLRFNFFKLRTRFLIHKLKNRTEKMKLANFLTVIYRIINEEFLSETSEEIDQGFYKARVKSNLASLRNAGSATPDNLEEMRLNVRSLEEYEQSLRLNESLNELAKRIHLDGYFEEQAVPAPTGERAEEGKEYNEMMTILKQLG